MAEKPQNITINRGSTSAGPVIALWQTLPPLGWSGSPVLGGGRYHPENTAVLSELPSTTNTFVSPEESIGDMPLSPIGCGVDKLWPLMATMRWMPDPAGVLIFWHYHCSAVV